MFQGIRLRLLALVLAAEAPFAALIGAGIWDQWRIEQSQALQFAQSEARAVAARVDDHIGNLDNLLTGLAQAISLNPANVEANDAILKRVMAEQPDYVGNITLLGLDGYSIGAASGARYYGGDRLYFHNVLAGERLAIGEPVRGRATPGWIVTLARPVEDSQGNLRAVLTVATRLDKFQDVLTPRTLPIGSLVRLINESSIVISDGWNNLDANDRNHVQFERGIRHIVAKNTALRMKWSDDVERITGTSSTTRTRWIVSVGLPTEVALAPVIARLKWSLMASAGALAIAFVIAWMFSTRIVRPMRELAEDASILAGGELSHRAMIVSKDEVGALADSFNQMAASLERRQQEVGRNAAEVQEAKGHAQRRDRCVADCDRLHRSRSQADPVEPRRRTHLRLQRTGSCRTQREDRPERGGRCFEGIVRPRGCRRNRSRRRGQAPAQGRHPHRHQAVGVAAVHAGRFSARCCMGASGRHQAQACRKAVEPFRAF